MATDNTKKLDDMLRPHRQELDVLQEALQEVSKEDAEKRKTEAKELIRRALDLQKQMDQAEKQFLGQKKKWDKELGKALKRLQNMANNRPLDEGIDEKEEKESENEEDTQ